MTRSVYLIGGAGVGKSTFMGQLLADLGCQMGPLADLWTRTDAAGKLITLRGHHVVGELGEGVYLGRMRDQFPGTDGLDRASSPVGAEWLNKGEVPSYVLGEGATLATRPFLTALYETTDTLFVHLFADPVVVDLRQMERGGGQTPQFVQATATRSSNLVTDLSKLGARFISIDAGEPLDWATGLQVCRSFLQKG